MTRSKEKKIIRELEKVAEIFKYVEFGQRDFNRLGNISASTVKNEFGTWRNGLKILKEHLRKKDLNLKPRKVPYNQTYSDKELFKEMDRIWTQLKHRPSRNEWELSYPKISYGTYRHRFKGWQNACLKFIEYKMGGTILVDTAGSSEAYKHKSDKNSNKIVIGRFDNLQTLCQDCNLGKSDEIY